MPYPFKLQNSRFGSIYGPPYFTGYWFKVTIPAKADKATVQCRIHGLPLGDHGPLGWREVSGSSR